MYQKFVTTFIFILVFILEYDWLKKFLISLDICRI